MEPEGSLPCPQKPATQSIFFSQGEKPRFTPMKTILQNHSFVYFNLYDFREETGRQKTEASIFQYLNYSLTFREYNFNFVLSFLNIWTLSSFQNLAGL
jgi:hypothetical protein